MISINSILIYGSRICKVSDIREENLGKNKRMYYILSPIYDNKNTIYVPLDNPELVNKMKAVLTKDELFSLLENIPKNKDVWIDNHKERPLKFKEILEKGQREEIILVIKALKSHKVALEAVGKSLHSCDELLLTRAQTMIYDEFAYILDIKPNEVEAFLETKNAKF